ncbi:bifunctional GNAT family N-acetyltransferase/acetate--CoA ligase family protein [Frankia sp. Cppng1_Ct_nod]|uniref:bifunctional acetate--CoA ligase family protein/GNAT family N-acetyltransferase n=1 Tax=Frankia sp. Cppng1_Ct_nod TaxID=2897162 RepID=UPI002023F52A|nr:bifunctional GNAT family N-acetyltransferase/acetate--CoA ligase family protein [Frankia sp. Cppng1_Ct_nod]
MQVEGDAAMVYPARWEADVVLADGGTSHLRPVLPADGDRLRAFWGRLSTRSIYFRFFSARGPLTDADVNRMTVVDQWVRGALVALIGDEIVAFAHWEGVPGQQPAGEPGQAGPDSPPPGARFPAPAAEVAFLVEDAHQGRGLGSVLLEHLAAAAAERGIRRFDADVLGENRQMIGVFLDAGYTVSRAWDSGAVRLSFEIAPTKTSVDVMRAREHHAEAASIVRLLHPRSIAVIGASRDRDAVGHTVLRHLLAGGFAGPVYPVNPAAAEFPGAVASVRAVASVTDIEGPVDLAVVCVPPPNVSEVIEQCGRKGVRGLVVLTDLGDYQMEIEVTAAARASGMRVVGPASLGIQNLATGLNASLAPRMPAPGRVGCYSQSGPLGAALLDAAAGRGVGLSGFVSAGDRVDVSGNDLLQYWEEDPATDVVFMHVETFGNPRKFARLARRVGRRTPVVVVTSGRSTLDDALLRQTGVIRVDRISQGFDVALLLTSQPLPAGRRVAVVGDSRALVWLTCQAAEASGLEVERILLPGGTAPEVFTEALVDAAGRADALIATVVRLSPSEPGPVAVAVAAAAQVVDVPVLATVLGIEVPPELAPVPGYPSPEGAVAALVRAVSYARWRAEPTGSVPDLARRVEEARTLLAGCGGPLDDARTAELLDCYGIDVQPFITVGSADEAVLAAERLGWPVALKARIRPYRHRPELGGQRLDLAGPMALRAAWSSMTTQLGVGRGDLGQDGADGSFVVQRMAPAGIAVVVGSLEHPRYGPLVSFGLAGPATDLLGDRAHHILPLTDVDAAKLVRSVRAAPLLFGYRGAEKVDVAALELLLMRVARLADDLPDVASLTLHPVIVSRSSVTVLSAEVAVGRGFPRADAGPRKLWAPAPKYAAEPTRPSLGVEDVTSVGTAGGGA